MKYTTFCLYTMYICIYKRYSILIVQHWPWYITIHLIYQLDGGHFITTHLIWYAILLKRRLFHVYIFKKTIHLHHYDATRHVDLQHRYKILWTHASWPVAILYLLKANKSHCSHNDWTEATLPMCLQLFNMLRCADITIVKGFVYLCSLGELVIIVITLTWLRNYLVCGCIPHIYMYVYTYTNWYCSDPFLYHYIQYICFIYIYVCTEGHTLSCVSLIRRKCIAARALQKQRHIQHIMFIKGTFVVV